MRCSRVSRKLTGRRSGSAGVSLDHVPARDRVAGGELFEHHSGNRTDIEGIDLHQIAGLRNSVLLGFADGIGPGTESTAAAGDAAPVMI
jgi:hypothetical protein